MKKALFTLLLIAATCSVALAQNNASRVIVATDTVACESFVWSANGQTYYADTTQTYINASNDTLFVLNLTITQHVTVSEPVTLNRCSYVWRGETYSTSGTYSDTVAAPGGCDSVFNLILTLDNVESDTTVTNACVEYVWNGDTLIATGLYADSTLANNCLHIDVLNLSILTQLDRYDTVENCGNYVWYGDTLTADNDYTHLFVDTVNHCDTLFHLNLAIVMNEADTVYDSVCGSRVWGADTLDQTGVYNYYDTVAATGCITRHTLDLKVKSPRTAAIDTTVSSCARIEFTFSYGNAATTRAFPQTTDFDTIMGLHDWETCLDSTIHLHAIVRASASVDTVAFACDSFYWDRTKRTYKTDDEVRYTLEEHNVEGCDSIIVLNLTIKKSPVISAINGEWRLSEGDTARLYPTATQGSTYQWTVTPNMPYTLDADTIVIPNVQGNIDVALMASINYSEANIVCHDTSWITIVTYVGLDNVNLPSVSLYPNPTVGQLNIECAEAVREVSVFNALGQQVATASNLGTKSLLNLSALSRGTYSMRIVLANGESIVRKFVITK